MLFHCVDPEYSAQFRTSPGAHPAQTCTVVFPVEMTVSTRLALIRSRRWHGVPGQQQGLPIGTSGGHRYARLQSGLTPGAHRGRA
jgi:hypothetical protein